MLDRVKRLWHLMFRYRVEAEKREHNKMKIALIVGHSQSSQGAVNNNVGISEFEYNEQVISLIHNKMLDTEMHIDVVYRGSYSHLPDKVNVLRPDWVISFHCNAYNTKAGGTEVLYHHTSTKGKWLAERFQKALLTCFDLKNRGVKPKSVEDRGGYVLRYTHAPCVILEPFFIDNDSECKLGIEKMEDYANTVVDVLRNLHDGTS